MYIVYLNSLNDLNVFLLYIVLIKCDWCKDMFVYIDVLYVYKLWYIWISYDVSCL